MSLLARLLPLVPSPPIDLLPPGCSESLTNYVEGVDELDLFAHLHKVVVAGSKSLVLCYFVSPCLQVDLRVFDPLELTFGIHFSLSPTLLYLLSQQVLLCPIASPLLVARLIELCPDAKTLHLLVKLLLLCLPCPAFIMLTPAQLELFSQVVVLQLAFLGLVGLHEAEASHAGPLLSLTDRVADIVDLLQLGLVLLLYLFKLLLEAFHLILRAGQ